MQSFRQKSIVMKKKLLLLLLVVQSGFMQSQTLNWQKLYGGTDSDKGTCLLTPNSLTYPMPNGYYIGGYYKSTDGDFTSNQGNYDAFVMSVDASGNMLWQTTFGGSNADYIYDIAYDDTGLFVTGATKSDDGDITSHHGNYDYFVAKLDFSGNLIWVKTFGGSDVDKATSITVDQSNSTLKVLGYSKSVDGDIATGSNHGGYDIWLINLDLDGNLLSQHTYGGSNDDKSTELNKITGVNGERIITGYSKSSDGDLTTNHGNYDYWIFQIDSNDNIVWQQSYGGSGIDKEPYITSFSGMTTVVGTSNSNDGDISNPLGNFDIWLLQISENNGQIYSQANIGGSGADFATDIIDFPLAIRSYDDGSYAYISAYSNSDDGNFDTNNGNYDSWIVGLDFSTDYNTFHLGGNDVDEILAIDKDYSLGVSKSIDGTFNTQHGNYDIWLINSDMPIIDTGIDQPVINVKTFPNPVTDIIQVESEYIQKIEVFDMFGKLVKSYKVPALIDVANINLSGLSSGEYLLKTTTKKGVGLNKITKK